MFFLKNKSKSLFFSWGKFSGVLAFAAFLSSCSSQEEVFFEGENFKANTAISPTPTPSTSPDQSPSPTPIINPAVAPSIQTQPASATVIVGANVFFNVRTSGTAPLTYQWMKNGANITDATTPTLSLPNVQLGDAANYTVKVSNSVGNITSSTAVLTVNAAPVAPSIQTQPVSATVVVGANISFTVSASGTAPLTYQWMKNGADISGATAATLTLTNVQTSNAGNYSVKITNSVNNITSSVASLTVIVPPVAPSIQTQPASATVIVGANISFTVSASGTAPLTYQWMKNGANITGATAATLSLANVQMSDAANYTVRVSNSVNNIVSSAAALTVNAAPVAPSIQTQPASASVNAGSNASFSVSASGTAPLTYQWMKGGADISGATAAILNLTNVQPNNAGNYTVKITNSVNNITSSAAWLTVIVTPTVPLVPSGLSTVTAASDRINLLWLDNSNNETGFKIERATSVNGPFAQIATTAANATSYSDTALSPTTTYTYQIRAFNTAGDSAYTSKSSATTDAAGMGEIIPAARRIDWSNAGVIKPDETLGIPAAGTRCATLSPGATAEQINAAIKSSACSNSGPLLNQNKEVYLTAGNYILNKPIEIGCDSEDCTRNVTLRGAGSSGPNATILKMSAGGDGAIRIYGSGGGTTPYTAYTFVNWLGGEQIDIYKKGETILTMQSTSTMAAGDVLQLDQLNDNVDVTVLSSNTNAACGECSRNSGARAQQQWVRIKRIIDSTHLEITPGLYMSNWRKSQMPTARAWKDLVQMVGIEDLAVVNVNSSSTRNIMMSHAYNCWFKNIRSENSNKAHIQLVEGGRVEVRRSFFSGANPSGGDARGLFFVASSDNLFIDNIFEAVPYSVAFWGSAGSVIAYNYVVKNSMTLYPNNMVAALQVEGGHSVMNLFEGNISPGVSFNNNHGSNAYNTAFRNRLSGVEAASVNLTVPVTVAYFSRYANIIGNILGKLVNNASFHTNYEAVTSNLTDKSIYSFGRFYESMSSTAYDPQSYSTVYRHKNFDYKSNAIVLDPNVDPAVSLPASLYVQSKPDWFDRPIWPPFDPSVRPADDPELIPAGYRYMHQ